LALPVLLASCTFAPPLIEGTIIDRYKRFFADIKLPSGKVVTAHTPNTGSMKTCWEPGWPALISKSDNPKRKLQYTLEMTNNGSSWIGVHTGRPNKLVKNFIAEKQIPELREYDEIQAEVTVGESRLDLVLTGEGLPNCFIEIKNVTMKGDTNLAVFPDAVSSRGLKHLQELIHLKSEGHRAVMFYLVQREDVSCFSPAFNIDPEYSFWLGEAMNAGVEVLVYQCRLNNQEIGLKGRLPIKL
jgi:sugar fermentation stimulation protein A